MFKMILALSILASACSFKKSESTNETQPLSYLFDNSALVEMRSNITSGKSSFEKTQLTKQGQRHLNCGPYSVTFKQGLPISGDLHDYMSLAPYYWPNPKTKDHLPYVRRDGEVNPETKLFGDEHALYKMTDCLSRLSLTSYLLQEKEFGERASDVLRTWFLNPKTRMNPHLKYANARKGHAGSENGRALGIEVGRVFPRVVDSILLLDATGFLSKEDRAALRTWFNDYLAWLLTSPEGKSVAKEDNNIGLIYFTQVADIALFVDKVDIAQSILKEKIPEMIRKHIEPDGRLPAELERTRAWAYSHTALRHFFDLAFLADRAGNESLWNFETQDRRSIKRAFEFLVPFALKEKSWPYPQIDPPFDPQRTAPFLWRAANIWNDKNYREQAEKLLQSVDATDAIWVRLGSLEPI